MGSNFSGFYTTAAGYQHTTVVPHVPPDPTIWKAIWTSKSIPKIDMFVWTMAHRGILTGENLRRRGWEGPHRCPLCSQEEETTDHLLLSCVYSKEVWQLALGLQPNTLNLPQEASSCSKIGIPFVPSRQQKRAKSPPYGELSQNSFSGKFGSNEITGYLGRSKVAQLKLQQR
jgi:hypothetical protein